VIASTVRGRLFKIEDFLSERGWQRSQQQGKRVDGVVHISAKGKVSVSAGTGTTVNPHGTTDGVWFPASVNKPAARRGPAARAPIQSGWAFGPG
jgi:hypothetical protein